MSGVFPYRFRCGDGPRLRVDVRAKDETDAKARAGRLRKMVSLLVKAGRSLEAAGLLSDAAAEPLLRDFAQVERAGLDLAAVPVVTPEGEPAAPVSPVTYREVVRRWLSGEFHAEDPRGVPRKGPKGVEQDWSVYNATILGFVLDKDRKTTLGDKPIALVTKADLEAVKKSIGADYADGSYRRYCTLIRRPMVLAAQFGIIERDPTPPKFVPPEGKTRTGTYIYPDEDRAYLGDTRHRLVDRLAFGFGERNGTRPGELAKATWGDVDMKHRTFTLDINKTATPRQWRLEEDSFRMLELIRPTDPKDTDLIFVGFVLGHCADRFQRQLENTEGCDRREMFANTAVRRPVCAHTVRGTFVTLALASAQRPEGAHRTEMWVRDRTGHTTDREMQRYRKAARFAAEHEHTGWLDPLHTAIPELRRLAALRAARTMTRPVLDVVGHAVGQSPALPEQTAAASYPSCKVQPEPIGPALEATPEGLGGPEGGPELTEQHENGSGVLSVTERQAPRRGGRRVTSRAKTPSALPRVAPELPSGPPPAGVLGQAPTDPLELALERATRDREYGLATELIAEIRERRRARMSPDIVDLAAARAKRRK
jgi:integrase